MKTRALVLLTALTIVSLIGAGVSAPRALRRMDSFRVRRVEVSGTRYLSPHDALRASGIGRKSNVFDDFAVWARALENLSSVTSVQIERKLPSTIVISIVEAEPVALWADGLIKPVNAAGEVLPLDPSKVDLDLPVITSTAAQPLSRAVLSTLLLVQRHEPAMYGWISDAQAVPSGVSVRLRAPAGAVVLLPTNPQPATLRELRTTLADLAARQDITRLIRIDARFRDQIVVALSPTAAL